MLRLVSNGSQEQRRAGEQQRDRQRWLLEEMLSVSEIYCYLNPSGAARVCEGWPEPLPPPAEADLLLCETFGG